MSEAKFTKAPWYWEHDNETASVIQISSASKDEAGDPDICRIQNEYNAHLIAAAPEMYYEIESDIFRLEQRMKFKDENREIMPMLEAERDRKVKLLAKARGES